MMKTFGKMSGGKGGFKMPPGMGGMMKAKEVFPLNKD